MLLTRPSPLVGLRGGFEYMSRLSRGARVLLDVSAVVVGAGVSPCGLELVLRVCDSSWMMMMMMMMAGIKHWRRCHVATLLLLFTASRRSRVRGDILRVCDLVWTTMMMIMNVAVDGRSDNRRRTNTRIQTLR